MESYLARAVTGRSLAVLAGAVLALWILTLARSHQLGGPPHSVLGDEPEYDNIAYQIWTRHRVALDYQDAGFLQPYAGSTLPDGESYATSVAHRLSGLTTYRPPLFPAMMAIMYSIAGRNFALIRILNLLAGAMALGITAWICRRTIGAGAALIVFALMAWQGGFRSYGTLIMTESLTAMFVALALAALVLGLPKRPVLFGAATGGLWALAVLTRTGLVFWLPTLAVSLVLIVWRAGSRDAPGSRPQRVRAAGRSLLACLGAFILLTAPWMIRNSIVLHAAMPLGSQGYSELPAGFSEAAVRSRGVWVKTDSVSRFAATTLPDYEREKARSGKAAAMAWIRQHVRQLPALTIGKLRNEWAPTTLLGGWILLAALIGLACYRRTALGLACAGLIAGDVLMIAASWSVEGRFTFPAEPALYCLAAAGACEMFRAAGRPREASIARGTGSPET